MKTPKYLETGGKKDDKDLNNENIIDSIVNENNKKPGQPTFDKENSSQKEAESAVKKGALVPEKGDIIYDNDDKKAICSVKCPIGLEKGSNMDNKDKNHKFKAGSNVKDPPKVSETCTEKDIDENKEKETESAVQKSSTGLKKDDIKENIDEDNKKEAVSTVNKRNNNKNNKKEEEAIITKSPTGAECEDRKDDKNKKEEKN